ncbi:YicC/YloC family endoribonuclease [Ferroacidibacillus organovorans]|nr:YicC/YloC family endoribonuclease [Ferroacidibacillus organovorans]
MTGYGHAEGIWGNRVFLIEIRSVNHRYLDVVFRLPRELLRLESALRDLVKNRVNRGRVEIYLSEQPNQDESEEVSINEGVLNAAFSVLKRATRSGFVDMEPPSVGHLLMIPGLFSVRSTDAQTCAGDDAQLFAILEEALQEFIARRRTEGLAIKAEILRFLDRATSLHAGMKGKIPAIEALERERIMVRMHGILGSSMDLASERLAVEVAYHAARNSVEEEMARIECHLSALRSLCLEDGAVGRRMEFLLQELQREINTLGAKAADLRLTQDVLELKHTLEQLKEQVQNIE